MSFSWVALAAGAARADVVISNDPTHDMACAGGVCAPTTPSAVLNVGDLAALLAAGSVTVTTTSAGVQAGDIRLVAPLTWTAATTLTLDAHASVAINKLVQVAGAGGVALTINDGGRFGALSFGKRGHVVFKNLAGTLRIGGTAYTLVASVLGLSAAIAKNPAGAYALAGDYDASADGTYPASPVATTFTGSFSGLGNTIGRLSIDDETPGSKVGMFADLGAGAIVSAIHLTHVKIKAAGSDVGSLAGLDLGTVTESTARGSIFLVKTGPGSQAITGGLIGFVEQGVVSNSTANVAIEAGKVGGLLGGLIGQLYDSTAHNVSALGSISALNGAVGGLIGEMDSGTLQRSFATGNVSTGERNDIGGLVAAANGLIVDCYASGSVLGGSRSNTGGFVGYNDGNIATSYSVGSANAGGNAEVGGFAGQNEQSLSSGYWDIDTSGRTTGVGAGLHGGLKGLTNAELQAELPKGFDKRVWGENPSLNGGFPYLLANPPI